MARRRFEGEWKERRLGDHLRFLRHRDIPRSDLTGYGTVKYVHYGDIHKAADVYLDPNVSPMPIPEDANEGGFHDP